MFLRESVQHQSAPDNRRSVQRRATESVNMLFRTAAKARAQSEKAQEGLSIILDGSVK